MALALAGAGPDPRGTGYAHRVFPSWRQLGQICLVWAVVAWYTVAVWTWKATDADLAGAFGAHYAVRAPLVGALMGLLWSPLFVLGYHPARAMLASALGLDIVASDPARRHIGRHFRGAVLGQLVGASISLTLLLVWPIELMNSRWDAVKWVALFWKLYWYLFVPAGAVAGAGSVAMAVRHRIRPEGTEGGRPLWDPAPDVASADAWGRVDLGLDALDLDRVEQASATAGLALLADRSVSGPACLRGAGDLRVQVAFRPDPDHPDAASLVVTLTSAPLAPEERDAALARVLAAVATGAGSTLVAIGTGSPMRAASFLAAVAATLPPHLPAELFVRLVEGPSEHGAAAISEGLERYALPEVVAHAATPEAARAAAWSLVRRSLVTGLSLSKAPRLAREPHPDGQGRSILRYTIAAP